MAKLHGSYERGSGLEETWRTQIYQVQFCGCFDNPVSRYVYIVYLGLPSRSFDDFNVARHVLPQNLRQV